MGVVFIIKNKAMALVKYGTIVTEIKGKVGGQVFQRCGQSLSMRNTGPRIYTQSQQKSLSMNVMSQVSSQWRGLTTAQKTNWYNVASSYPTFDKFGNPIVLSGYQLFIMLNKRMRLAVHSYALTASSYAPPSLSDIDFDPYSYGAHQWGLLFNFAIAANTGVILYTTDPEPRSLHYTKPKYHFSTFIVAGTALHTNMYTPVTNAFRTPALSGYYFQWLAYKIDLITGQAVIDNGASEFIYP
jgi:hypothetical protein